ncbi:MAG: TonB-dependent receptor [Gammaproteobacteria bacterium]|nr:TonB-dependent receptor [Gammaproteobacteria bacterium]
MKRCLLNVFISSILLSYIHTANAQEATEEEDLYLLYGDDEMISIATGVTQPIAVAPSTASVITAEDIKAMGAMTIDEVLERVPGLHVEPSTLDRLDPVYTFRGLYTGLNPQVLFLLNGHRMSSNIFNGSLLQNLRINVQNISRIEVVRGPGSAVYGADAFAGVINIVTKSANDLDGAHFGARVGSFGTKNMWAQYGGDVSDDWDLAVNFEFAKQDADESRIVSSDTQSGLDDAFSTSASLSPSYLDRRYEALTYNIHLNNDNWKIGLDGWSQRDNGLGAGAAQAIDHEGYDDIDQWLISAEYNNKSLIKNWDLTGKVSYQYNELQAQLNILPPGTTSLIGTTGNIDVTGVPVTFSEGLIGNPGGESFIPQIDLIGIYDGTKNHTWRVNLGAKNEKLKASETKNFGPGVLDNPVPFSVVDGTLTDVTGTQFVYVPDKDRTVMYVSIQDIWELAPDWTLTAGVRYDDYSDFGGTTNPRLALVWTTTQKMITKLLYGSAFRAPSFSEQFSQNNPVLTGNPDLIPETMDTLELSFIYQFTSALNANFNIYTFETEDMIEFVTDTAGKTAQNAKNLDGEGYELELDWSINRKFDLMFNYAYQVTEDKFTGVQEPFSAQNQLYIDARWKFMTDWQVSSQVNWVGSRSREPTDTRGDIDDYTLVNLTLRRSNVMGHWGFAVTVSNLFDEGAKEPSALANNLVVIPDYLLNERAVLFEARYEM